MLLSCLFLFFVINPHTIFASEPTFIKENVPLDKVWTITFNQEVDFSTVNNENIYVTDRYGNKISTFFGNEMNPPKNQVKISSTSGYTYSTEYLLHLTQNLKDKNGNSLNKPTVLKFKTVDNPTIGEIGNIHTAEELSNYLNAHYSVLDTAVGKWGMKFTSSGSPNSKLRIVTSWQGGSPYTLHYDDDELEALEYGRPITNEEATLVKKQLRDFQREVATIAMAVFPNAAIEGGYYQGGYKYPNLQVGYWSVPFLSWKNFYGDGYDTTNTSRDFHWYPKNDDYNFVTNQPIKKVYVIDPTTGKYIAYEDTNKVIKIKKGEQVQFAFGIPIYSNLTYSEIGLSYTYSDYAKKNIISIDEMGNITGNKAGEQSISVSYYWDPYVYHYFTIKVEE